MRGGRRAHAADEKRDRVDKIGNVGIAHGVHEVGDAGIEWFFATCDAMDSKRQLNLQVYLASLAAKFGWRFCRRLGRPRWTAPATPR